MKLKVKKAAHLYS